MKITQTKVYHKNGKRASLPLITRRKRISYAMAYLLASQILEKEFGGHAEGI